MHRDPKPSESDVNLNGTCRLIASQHDMNRKRFILILPPSLLVSFEFRNVHNFLFAVRAGLILAQRNSTLTLFKGLMFILSCVTVIFSNH